ncbi:MAG: site-specific integrase [Marmoricola sp.]|nr:site-specific integrase [Marmoricola sp.]
MSKRRGNGEGSIYKTAKGYRGYVWVTTPEGLRTRKYVAAQTAKAVREELLKIERAAMRGPVSTHTATVAGYIRQWLDEVVRPSLAPSTVSNYEMFSRLYVVPALGDQRLNRLTVRDVQIWVNRLRVTCQCCAQGKDESRPVPVCCAIGQCCQQIPKEWTVRQAWAVLRAALSQAVRDELIERNVASLVRMPIPRPARQPIWSVEDARRFLESSQHDADSSHAGYVLMLVLGLRRGELLGLSWSDIDVDSRELRVRQQLQRVDGELILRPTKTASSEGLLPLPDICLEALLSHQLLVTQWSRDAGPAWHETGLVFTTRYGLPVDPRNFHRKFKVRAEKASVPVVSVHSTRRTCASLLVELDVHPRVAMQILRHSQIAVTMDIYSQVTSASTRDALTRLGSRLGPI